MTKKKKEKEDSFILLDPAANICLPTKNAFCFNDLP